MTALEIDESERALASPGWRWMPGMDSTHGRCVLVGPKGPIFWGEKKAGKLLPVLSDPATQGCLAALGGAFEMLTVTAEAVDDDLGLRALIRACLERGAS